MRVFIPQHCIPDSFVDNVRVTLELMGHSVRTLGDLSPRRSYSLLAKVTAAIQQTISPDDDLKQQLLMKVARDFRPELVLGLTSSLHGETLRGLKRLSNALAVLWWGDSAANSRRWGLVDPEWDLVFVKDRSVSAKLGIVRSDVFHLPEAMNPLWHRPVAVTRSQRLAFVGNAYAFRQALIVRLDASGYEVELHGPPPPRWSHPRIEEVHSGRYVVKEEKSRVFGEAAACVNTFALSEADSLNCRAFEIAGAGGMQIIEDRKSIEEYFEPGRELLTFGTWDELCSILDRAVAHDPELEAIRSAGIRRANAEHTYEKRLRSLIHVTFGGRR